MSREKHSSNEAKAGSLERASEDKTTSWAAVIGLLVAIFGAIFAFVEYREFTCQHGDGHMCFVIGSSREFVRRGQADPVDAVNHYKLACDFNYAKGCRAIANSYRTGYGNAPIDPALESAAMQKACRLGLADQCVK